MTTYSKPQNNKRNKLLHRFYEPLVLLYVLDRTQGDHLARPTADSSPLEELKAQELRRRFLDALSYVCDFDKGGDTITAIGITSAPLTYHVACNKTPGEKVAGFLHSLFARLVLVYEQNSQQRTEEESKILRECVGFAEKRLRTYWKLLQESLIKCRDALKDEFVLNMNLEEKLSVKSHTMLDLCLCCDRLMKSDEMKYIKGKATDSEDYGNRQSPYALVRHFIGRLACHPRSVRTLISAASRLPALFMEPQVTVVDSPPSLVLPPNFRTKSDLDGISSRMISGDQPLLQDLQARLRMLDQAHSIGRIVKEEYTNKNFRPRVHAELVLLEYFYQNRQHLCLLDSDYFIGTSKPSCYCCYLYFRAHPGNFIEPATHQKIYLNWMPPTSIAGVEDSNSDLAKHERTMLNKMVESIRMRTINQIMSQSGRRQKHFDSVTGDTFSARIALESRWNDGLENQEDLGNIGKDDGGDQNENPLANLSHHFAGTLKFENLDSDSDTAGGVSLI